MRAEAKICPIIRQILSKVAAKIAIMKKQLNQPLKQNGSVKNGVNRILWVFALAFSSAAMLNAEGFRNPPPARLIWVERAGASPRWMIRRQCSKIPPTWLT